MKKYDIAAYVWPAYTGDEPRIRMFWPEGIGEWQSVKNVGDIMPHKPEGYVWDRKPLWGYVNEADPYVMEMQIEAAVRHGVNVVDITLMDKGTDADSRWDFSRLWRG